MDAVDNIVQHLGLSEEHKSDDVSAYRMRYWKFICSRAAEAECFQRRLFGLSEKYEEQVRQVRAGDGVVLYNFETDTAFLSLTADSDGGLRIDLEAWAGSSRLR